MQVTPHSSLEAFKCHTRGLLGTAPAAENEQKRLRSRLKLGAADAAVADWREASALQITEL